jgi:hypothetical protein
VSEPRVDVFVGRESRFGTDGVTELEFNVVEGAVISQLAARGRLRAVRVKIVHDNEHSRR